MDTDPYFISSAYTGSKDFSQERVETANATGFGAAADDYAERGIDLNEQLVKNKPATFFMRVNSDAMIGAGIHKGDIVIVDRSLEVKKRKNYYCYSRWRIADKKGRDDRNKNTPSSGQQKTKCY